jgi:AraC-like DNA-binding protein
VRPETLLLRVGIDPSIFSDPENLITFEAGGEMLDECVRATGCEHFGLLVAERSGLSSLGVIGALMRHSFSVETALRVLLLHLHLTDRGATATLQSLPRGGVALGYVVHRADTPGMAHIYDIAMAVARNFLRELCGAHWKPAEVRLVRTTPRNAEAYRSFFDAPVRFDASHSSIVFPSHWLEQRVADADPAQHAHFERLVADLEAADSSTFVERVRRLLSAMVIAGTASVDGLAHAFSLHRRTLHRRLEAEGTSVQALLNATRYEIARQLLRETRLPLTAIAAALRFSDPSAFSRAFRAWSGTAPSVWRLKPTNAVVARAKAR